MAQHLLERTCRHDLAAVTTGARAQIYDIIRSADRFFIVLHDQYRVAEVAQLFECREQACIVALMQADRRLVEDVQHADEAAPDLCREADPLRLAARKSHGGTFEREIVETDVDEEAQPVRHFFQDWPRDLRIEASAAIAAHRDFRKEVERLPHRERPDLADILAGHEDRQALRLETATTAGGARLLDHVLLELFAHRIGRRLAVALLDVIEHPLPARSEERRV